MGCCCYIASFLIYYIFAIKLRVCVDMLFPVVSRQNLFAVQALLSWVSYHLRG